MAESMNEMLQTLTSVLQGLNVQKAPPPVKLSKYKGTPQVVGDLSLQEWLDNFESYARHYSLEGIAKAQSFIDHLTGAAKEEILCRDESVRKDCDKLIEILKSLFGAVETVQSLTAEFYNRKQLGTESLLDYSRALMRIYNKMEKAASTTERKALEQLRDSSLKERFVTGTNQVWMQRELRRIEIAAKTKTFLEMREDVLEYFRGQETRKVAVHEALNDATEIHVATTKKADIDLKQEFKSLKDDVASLRRCVEALAKRKQKGPAPSSQKVARCFNCGKTDHMRNQCQEETLCFACKGRGHISKQCPQRFNSESPQSVNPPQSTSSTPRPEANRGAMDSQNVSPEFVETFIAPSPRGKMTIGGLDIGCIFDTGAESSIIPSSVYHRHLKERLGGLQHEPGVFLNVVGVGGIEVPIEGFIEVSVEISGQTLQGGFLVAEDRVCNGTQSDYPVLVGCNILRKMHEFSTGVGLHSHVLKEAMNSQKKEDCYTSVKTGKMEILPPYTIRRVVCQVENKTLFSGTEVLVREVDLPMSVATTEGCQEMKGDTVELFMMNHSAKEIQLPPDLQVAEALPVERKPEICLDLQEDQLRVVVCDVVAEKSQVQKEDKEESTSETGGISILPPGVKLDGLSREQEEKVKELLHKHADVFSAGAYDLGECSVVPHHIQLEDNPVVRLPYRRITPPLIPEVKDALQEMLDRGIIRPSKSPYASPVVLVRKKDGSLRLCIDYRKINSHTVKDSFPLPRIEEALDALRDAKYFTSMDLVHGYFQVVMDPTSIDVTAFRVPWGLYEFTRMPQGLVNSPSTFQRTMEYILGDLNLSQIILYLDDILVFSSTFEQHLERLDLVLTRLAENGLKVKGKKCHFVQQEVEYLGHVVTSEGVRMDPGKVEKIRTWPRPQNGKDVSSFLGLASYYRRFIDGFSSIAAPLHQVAEKGKGSKTKFVWGQAQEEAFEILKSQLTSTPVLTYPKFDEEFIVEVDASKKGLGACLLQKGEDGKVHPIAYASRSLRGAERNYSDFSSFKIELLALKWAITEKFAPYLMSSHCIVLTDHNPLAHLSTAKLGATESRWVAQLAPFDFEVRYRTGRSNKCADALSRRPNDMPQEEVTAAVSEVMDSIEIPQPSGKTWPDAHNIAIRVITDETTSYTMPSYSYEELAKLQKEDEDLKEVWHYWENQWQPGQETNTQSTSLQGWLREYKNFREYHGVLYREIDDPVLGNIQQLLIPRILRETMLELTHDRWGHQGVDRTLNLLRERCYWPGVTREARRYIKKCFRCITSKVPMPTIRPPQRHLLAFRPQEIIAVDFLKLDRGRGGFEDVLVNTDVFSKYCQAVPCKDQTAVTVAKVLRDAWFTRYGVPSRIHSDQGRSFENAIVAELCKLYNIQKSRTTAYHPAGNGQCERFNKTLCSLLRSLNPKDRRRWPELIQHMVYIYNTTPHRITRVTPHFLMFGRRPTLPVDHLLNNLHSDWSEDYTQTQQKLLEKAYKIVCDRQRETARKEEERQQARARGDVPTLEIGERVLLKREAFTGRHKLQDKFDDRPYIILAKNEEGDLFQIRPIFGGKIQWVNRRRLIADPHQEDDGNGLEEVLPCSKEGEFNDMNAIGAQYDDDDDSDSDDDDEGFGYSVSWRELPRHGREERSSGLAQERTLPRRSARSTKGMNHNPGRLPVSAITGLPV